MVHIRRTLVLDSIVEEASVGERPTLPTIKRIREYNLIGERNLKVRNF